VDHPEVSEALGMSSRTLQRKLRDEGKSFRALVETTRQELTGSYLDQGFSSTSVAYLLGFCSTSARPPRPQVLTRRQPGRCDPKRSEATPPVGGASASKVFDNLLAWCHNGSIKAPWRRRKTCRM